MDIIQKAIDQKKQAKIQQEIVNITRRMDRLAMLSFLRDGVLIGMLGICALMEAYSPKLKSERIPVGIFVATSVAYVGASGIIRWRENRFAKRLDALQKQQNDLERGNE